MSTIRISDSLLSVNSHLQTLEDLSNQPNLGDFRFDPQDDVHTRIVGGEEGGSGDLLIRLILEIGFPRELSTRRELSDDEYDALKAIATEHVEKNLAGFEFQTIDIHRQARFQNDDYDRDYDTPTRDERLPEGYSQSARLIFETELSD